MSIEQVAFKIPTEIERGIANGTLIRLGGVVRDPKSGQVVKLLEEVILPEEIKKRVGGRTINVVSKHGKQLADMPRDNPVASVLIGLVVVGVAGGTIYSVLKARKNQKAAAITGVQVCDAAETSDQIKMEFRIAVDEWLGAALNGAMTLEIIDRVTNAWNSYEKLFGASGIELDEFVVTVAAHMKAYVEQMRVANGLPALPKSSEDAGIFDITGYLKEQRTMFEKSA